MATYVCEDCKDEQDPCCSQGICIACTGDKGIGSCICCGAEMREINGYWWHHSQVDNSGKIKPESEGHPQGQAK